MLGDGFSGTNTLGLGDGLGLLDGDKDGTIEGDMLNDGEGD